MVFSSIRKELGHDDRDDHATSRVPVQGKPEIVRVPEMGFAMIDGRGDPNTSSLYAEAIQALYSLSYTLRFALKKELGLQYRVAPLEGLWWAEDMAAFSQERRATGTGP
jgi:hypothetical protein